MMEPFMDGRQCCRCECEQHPKLGIVFDWCRYCKRTYCNHCMNHGCCEFVPAVSGAQADTVVVHGSVIQAQYHMVLASQAKREELLRQGKTPAT